MAFLPCYKVLLYGDKKDKKEGDAEEGGEEAEAEDIGNNYKTFRNRIPYLVFNTLTADSVASDIEEQKKAKAQKGKEPVKDQKNQKKSKKDKDFATTIN